ncbi:MAG: sulfatase [Rubripirellula sp.]|nr:sulfatase [Rubripirellula sp.]
MTRYLPLLIWLLAGTTHAQIPETQSLQTQSLQTQSPEAETQNQPRPNIVFILIDDLRYDTFGFMGHPFIETPHLDAMANKGLQFRNAFVTTSLCSPSRASFLTGQYMHHHGVVDNADLMPAATVTFPQILQSADYQTAFIGKWHMGGSSDAPRPGFDHWVSFRGQGTYAANKQSLNVNGKRVARTRYMTDELTDYATDWISSQASGKPFMLYLSHKGVHGLYDPAPRHRDRYRQQEIVPPETSQTAPDQLAGVPMWVQDQRNSWHGVEHPYHGRAQQSIEQMYKHYCEMILSIDDSLGRVMKTLRDQNMDQNTLVMFTSDGGHLWGEHGLIDKRCAYEESIRIPMLIYAPHLISTATICDAVVANIDVAPTLLEMAGISPPESMDGSSFAGRLTGPTTSTGPTGSTGKPRQSLLYEYYWEPSFPQTPTTFAIRNQQFKLIQYHGIWDTDELFDIRQDPSETNNLIRLDEHQTRVSAMRRELHQRLKQTGGLSIRMGFKRNHGASDRNASGSQRAEFPAHSTQN